MRDSIYKRKRVEKSDWENESGPPHVEIANREGGRGRGGKARWATECVTATGERKPG